MLKKLGIVVCLGFVLVLIGCGRTETVTTCTVNQAFFGAEPFPGYSSVRLEARGNQVNVQTDTLNFEILPYLTFFNMTLGEVVEFWEVTAEFVPDGMSLEVSVTDTHIVITTVSDYTAMSRADLEAMLGQGARAVSLEMTVDNIENLQGGVCVVE